LGLSCDCPGERNKTPTNNLTKSTVDEGAPRAPEASATPPARGYVNEVFANKAIKPQNVTNEWERFLGKPPYTNNNPRTGALDPDRLVSSDGTRSIRYGAHEMNSKPSKHHYHEETWTLESSKNVMDVDNTVVRIQFQNTKK